MSDLKKTERFIVSGISLPIKASRDDAFGKAEKALLKFFSGDEILSYNISRRSVDARKKSDIRFVYSVSADVRSTKLYDVAALAADKITKVADSSIEAKHGPKSSAADLLSWDLVLAECFVLIYLQNTAIVQ